MCIRDFDKFNFSWWFNFRLEPISASAPAGPKNIAQLKVAKNDHLASFNKVRSKALIHSVWEMCLSVRSHELRVGRGVVHPNVRWWYISFCDVINACNPSNASKDYLMNSHWPWVNAKFAFNQLVHPNFRSLGKTRTEILSFLIID